MSASVTSLLRPATAPTSPGTRFAATFIALHAAHNLADYWMQTTHQATDKGRFGNAHENAAGRLACLSHVASYTAISTSAVVGANAALRLGLGWQGIVVGQLLSSASHYFADRRHTLRSLAARMGKLELYDSGEGFASGSVVLDQSWHQVWLTLAAFGTATIGSSSAPARSGPLSRFRPA
jgi:hypothetical protein